MTGTAAASAISSTVRLADSNLLGAQAVAGHVDDIIDPAEDTEVAVAAWTAPSPAR